MKFLDDLKISTKLIGGFLIIAAIVGIVAIIGYVNMGTINDGISVMYNNHLVPLNEVGDAESSLYLIRGDLYKYVSIPKHRDQIRKEIDAEFTNVEAKLNDFRVIANTDAEEKATRIFDEHWVNYKAIVLEHLAMADQGRETEVLNSLEAGA
ncbi:MAG TPA: MCP four helix bundle domain-containing protein [Methanospirillum sp.]|nr:MCP four helix bundle domain-containing protein [Methanospirillum sp.]